MSTNMVEINGLIFMFHLKCLWMESASLGQQITITDCSLGYEEEKKINSHYLPWSIVFSKSLCSLS